MDVKGIKDSLDKYFQEGVEAYLPHISVNCVVLTYIHPNLKVLVHKFASHNSMMIPGGYVKKTESVEEAAYRNLSLLGINQVFLRQIQTFGDVSRAFNITNQEVEQIEGGNKILNWVNQRFISVVYYGLVHLSEMKAEPGGFINEIDWQDVDHLTNLSMDHASIISETRKILAAEVLNHPVLSSLLPEMFTLNELRGLFEAILNRPIDRGTFRRKMLKLGLIEQVDQRQDNLGRPSHIFRFQKENYNRFLAEENKFGF